jgi:UPF0042 nucleotide-binding protein
MAKIKLFSFSFRDGAPPREAGFVLDCRNMRNPHHQALLRPLSGVHVEVQEFVRTDPKFKPMFDEALRMANYGEPVAFGCYGGRHRSVAMAELVARELRTFGNCVEVEHRALADLPSPRYFHEE